MCHANDANPSKHDFRPFERTSPCWRSSCGAAPRRRRTPGRGPRPPGGRPHPCLQSEWEGGRCSFGGERRSFGGERNVGVCVLGICVRAWGIERHARECRCHGCRQQAAIQHSYVTVHVPSPFPGAHWGGWPCGRQTQTASHSSGPAPPPACKSGYRPRGCTAC